LGRLDLSGSPGVGLCPGLGCTRHELCIEKINLSIEKNYFLNYEITIIKRELNVKKDLHNVCDNFTNCEVVENII